MYVPDSVRTTGAGAATGVGAAVGTARPAPVLPTACGAELVAPSSPTLGGSSSGGGGDGGAADLSGGDGGATAAASRASARSRPAWSCSASC
eukprot:SAG22_NODE_3186_length_1867_cov_5.987557_1_plen_91_part_10